MLAVYPGSFDPITNGHFDIIQRAAKVYDELIVFVATNASKINAFTREQRGDMIGQAVDAAGLTNVRVDCFSTGLLVDYVERSGSKVIVKGLRAVSDFEYEFQMALLNRHMRPDIETVFMMTSAEYSFLSSSIVREIALLGGEIAGLVPDVNIPAIQAVLRPVRSTDLNSLL